MQQRYYDPIIGRFLSTDPVPADDGSLFNRYSYAVNNPLRFVDPDGREAKGVQPGCGTRMPNTVASNCTPTNVQVENGESSKKRRAAAEAAAAAPTNPYFTPMGTLPTGNEVVHQNTPLEDVEATIVSEWRDLDVLRELSAIPGEGTLVRGSSQTVSGVVSYVRTLAVAKTTINVTRWGRPGLQTGDWVMKGGRNYWNYFWSGKWQPGMGNQFARYASGQTYQVPRSAVAPPPREYFRWIQWIKEKLGQAQYMGP
jgi:hypothetical protein